MKKIYYSLTVAFLVISKVVVVAEDDIERMNSSTCAFKSKYFSEFDLNPLTKNDGTLYTTDQVAFKRRF